jgi:hypothetical protein
MASRVEHACFDSAGWNPDHFGNLVYRLLVVVDEIENFPVGSRKMRQTFLNNGATIFFCTSVSGSSAGSSIMSSTPSFNAHRNGA